MCYTSGYRLQCSFTALIISCMAHLQDTFLSTPVKHSKHAMPAQTPTCDMQNVRKGATSAAGCTSSSHRTCIANHHFCCYSPPQAALRTPLQLIQSCRMTTLTPSSFNSPTVPDSSHARLIVCRRQPQGQFRQLYENPTPVSHRSSPRLPTPGSA